MPSPALSIFQRVVRCLVLRLARLLGGRIGVRILELRWEIAGLAGASFDDAKQLGRILAGSTICQDCVVRQVFRYAHGRPETDADEPAVARLAAAFRASGFRFKELLLGVVRSEEFSGRLP